jgi:hypothetical protein
MVIHDSIEMPEFSDAGDVQKWFAELSFDQNIKPDDLDDLIAKSTLAYKETMREALLSNTVNDETEIADNFIFVPQPHETVESVYDMVGCREVFRGMRSQYSESSTDNLEAAKRAIVDIYLARLNALLAGDFVILDTVANQAMLSGHTDVASEAKEMMPKGFRVALEGDRRSNAFNRIDYIRNGMGIDQRSYAPKISKKAVKSIVESPQNIRDSVADEKFTAAQIELLKNLQLQPDEIQSHVKSILEKIGKLNNYDEPIAQAKQRPSPIEDGTWQVLQSVGFGIDAARGIFEVPSKSRSLYSCLVTSVHELAHLDQAEADCKVGQELKIASLRGKRVLGIREAGADFAERQFEENLFGTSKPYSLAYANAFKILEQNGSLSSAAMEFYNTKLSEKRGANREQIATEAADRVLRLRRLGLNSQPLNYMEEVNLINGCRDLPLELQKRAIAVTCLDYPDQLRLHEFGLLPRATTDEIDWGELVIQEFTRRIEGLFGEKP